MRFVWAYKELLSHDKRPSLWSLAETIENPKTGSPKIEGEE